jgi:ribonuclease-3
MPPAFCYNHPAVNNQVAANLDALEEILEYKFADRSLLERAITHRSWAHEQVSPAAQEEARRLHNEAFEFLGDSVLGLIVANHLYLSNPDASEGELSRMKHRLVSAATLANVSLRMGLGEFVRFGRGEERSGGSRKRALLADVFEALTGAIFLEGGLEAARRFVELSLGEELAHSDPESAAAADHKTLLQETLQACKQPAPQYIVVETLGPPHQRIFHVEVRWNGGRVLGSGRTIKAAESVAARLALEQMQREAAPAAIPVDRSGHPIEDDPASV